MDGNRFFFVSFILFKVLLSFWRNVGMGIICWFGLFFLGFKFLVVKEGVGVVDEEDFIKVFDDVFVV